MRTPCSDRLYLDLLWEIRSEGFAFIFLRRYRFGIGISEEARPRWLVTTRVRLRYILLHD